VSWWVAGNGGSWRLVAEHGWHRRKALVLQDSEMESGEPGCAMGGKDFTKVLEKIFLHVFTMYGVVKPCPLPDKCEDF